MTRQMLLRSAIGMVAMTGLPLLAADQKPPTLHEAMKNVVAVQTQVVWDVSNDATDEDGNPDGSKLKPADWQKIASAARRVSEVAKRYAGEGPIVVVAPGQKIDGEGTANAWGGKEVQRAIDANPAAFRAFSGQMGTAMDRIVTATGKRDAKALADVAGSLDQVCESCHMAFWYPDQK